MTTRSTISDALSTNLAVDVLVIGGGGAAHCAALQAAIDGAEVLMVEKLPELGGNTRLSASFLTFAGTDMQAAEGIVDDADLLYRDLRDCAKNTNDPSLIRAYADGQIGLYDWLRGHGVKFSRIEQFAGQSVPRCHLTNPGEMLATLREKALLTGRVRIKTGTRATHLIQERDGRVIGANLSDDDGDHSVYAGCGVILACGGYAWAHDLVEDFGPIVESTVRFGCRGNTGDGIKMALKLGASLRDIRYVKPTFGTHPQNGPERHEMMFGFYCGAVVVNASGRRFMDESLSYKRSIDFVQEQPGSIGYQILDQKVFDAGIPGQSTHDFADSFARGFLQRFESLEDIALAYGFDREVLLTEIQRYNDDVRSTGVDSRFGRRGLVDDAGSLVPIEVAPFYVYPTVPLFSSTFGGLKVDTDARVIDVDGNAIEGLYAAGETTGGFHGNGYMTGTSVGKATFFGRRAGQMAARRKWIDGA